MFVESGCISINLEFTVPYIYIYIYIYILKGLASLYQLINFLHQ